jgi:acetylornithine deacetylase/succinyl-diaminopimelate desuccinylase-like protein
VNFENLDRALCGEIWASDAMDDLLREIASFGHRFTGSPGEKKARNAVRKRLEGWGLETRIQRFKVCTWERGPARLSIPALKIDLPALGMVYAGSTGERKRTFELVDLFEGTPGDFERNRKKLRGKAILFSKKEYVERDKKQGLWRYRKALEAGAKAFVVGTFRWPGVISAETLRVTEEDGPAPPAVTVSGESVAVLRRAARRGAKRIALATGGRDVSRFSGNLIAEIPGKRKAPAIVLGAHLDTFDISPGADDNGSGVAVVCEVARLLASSRVKLERTVRFVFFTGEELGRLGSRRYAETVGPDEVGVYFNFDLPANGGYPGLFTMMEKNDPGFWSRMQEEIHYRFPVREIVARASDHYSFYRRGIPCIWEIARNSGSRSPAAHHHTALDTLEYINSNELKEAATMAVKVVLHLARCEPFPFEPFEPVPEESVPHFS